MSQNKGESFKWQYKRMRDKKKRAESMDLKVLLSSPYSLKDIAYVSSSDEEDNDSEEEDTENGEHYLNISDYEDETTTTQESEFK